LVQLDVHELPGVDVAGYSGSYGVAGTPDESKASSAASADFSDSDGVLEHVTVSEDQVAATEWTQKGGELSASAQASEVVAHVGGIADLVTVSPIDSFAKCTAEGEPEVVLDGDAVSVSVLGAAIPTDGKRYDVEVTGEDIGKPEVDNGIIKVWAESVVETGERSAEAWFNVRMEAKFFDADGKRLDKGPLADLQLGRVSVECAPPVAEEPQPQLPVTGSSMLIPGLIGVAAVLVGVGALVLLRRRSAASQ
ncbi:MAG: LPXTG cell wall anchor domain-containing protein, partial [Stackebrandtia sp.]